VRTPMDDHRFFAKVGVAGSNPVVRSSSAGQAPIFLDAPDSAPASLHQTLHQHGLVRPLSGSASDLQARADPSCLAERRGRALPGLVSSWVPSWLWKKLDRALDECADKLESLSKSELQQLSALEDFVSIFPEWPGPLMLSAPSQAKRLLIVEDNPAVVKTLRGLLPDYKGVVTMTAAEAMADLRPSSHDESGLGYLTGDTLT
jgi:hypothetical protein